LTLLVGRQEGHPARKESGWWIAGGGNSVKSQVANKLVGKQVSK